MLDFYDIDKGLSLNDYPNDDDCLNMWCNIKYGRNISLKHSKAPLDGTTCGVDKVRIKVFIYFGTFQNQTQFK